MLLAVWSCRHKEITSLPAEVHQTDNSAQVLDESQLPCQQHLVGVNWHAKLYNLPRMAPGSKRIAVTS